jgi:mRNA-degrading endonuclease RelE of RelBE toxin-antitoxin system
VGEGEERARSQVKPLDIEFRPKAQKALKKIVAADRQRINAAIELLRFDPIPPTAKRLTGRSDYRIRIGKKLVIVIIDIGHRREIYRKK